MQEHSDQTPGKKPPEWARPKPVQRDSQFRAWMFFLAGVFALVALWGPVRAIYQRTRYKPRVEGARDAEIFVVLAYGGISGGRVQGPEEIGRDQFASHISTLRQRGFNPIGLSDVQAFYRDGQPLPRKAVLITMEQSKRSTYLESRSILRRNRWKAVMFVRADTIEQEDPDVLRWPILKEMSLSGTWDIGAESINGFEQITVGPDGKKKNFFSAPLWLASENRLETLTEYRARINAEHEAMVNLFESGVGRKPVAFAFPYGDYGQYDPRAVVSRVYNLEAVEQYYGIGFTLGPFMLNTRYSDPRALNRLLVDPEWSLEEFITIVESAQAVSPGAVDDAVSSARWRTTWGGMEQLTNGSLRLHALGQQEAGQGQDATTGALMWMVGSDLFKDFTVRMRFRRKAGHLSLRLRSRLGGEAAVRLLCGPDGVWRLVQKVYGAAEHIVAVARDMQSNLDTSRELQVTLQDRKAYIMLDGRMLFQEQVDLSGPTQPGMLGIEVWDAEPGVAEVEIMDINFPAQDQELLQWDTSVGNDITPLLKGLHGSAYRLAALCPPWLDVVRTVPLAMPGWDGESVRTFAGVHDIPLMPRMMVRSAEIAAQIPPELPAEAAAEMGVDGIYINCHQVDTEEITKLASWLQSVQKHIKEKNMDLAISLPAPIVRMASFASVAALFPGALIAVDSADTAADISGVVSNVVVSTEVKKISESDLHLDLFYQLGTAALADELDDPRTRSEGLWRGGLKAYQEGEYQQAVKLWNEWLEMDTRNTEALKLLARAYQRVGDNKKALEAYTKCQKIAPGRISTAIQRAELLDRMNRADEARKVLNLYASVFPENADILIAQSQWLNRRKRRLEARSLLERLVREQPNSVAARIALLNMQDDSDERFGTMRSLLSLGKDKNSQIPFSQVLMARELLTYPESSVFFDYIRRLALESDGDRERELFSRFLPLTNAVSDDFMEGRLSDGWIASGGIRTIDRGRYELRAALDQAESYLRLRRSELMRDAYLEVALDESQGFFWIYARRSSHAMVRFGFDEEGYIYLQAWNQGELVSHRRQAWIRPPGRITIRLEMQGDGARGYVNGLEVFDTPLTVPREVAYGWWGIAPFSFELGLARARITKMTCAPSPTSVVLCAPDEANNVIRALRPLEGRISALSPALVVQKPDGTLPDTLPDDADVLRMYCAFNCIRLLPTVDLAYRANIDPGILVDFIKANNMAGIIIKQRVPPDNDWLAAMQKELEKRPASVMVMQTEAALWNYNELLKLNEGRDATRPVAEDALLPSKDEPVRLHEIPVGNVLIPPLQEKWSLELSVPDSTNAFPVKAGPQLHLLDDGKWQVNTKD